MQAKTKSNAEGEVSERFFWIGYAVVAVVKLALEAGKATPAPPVGPALGSKGVNIMAFCKEYNAKTADKPGYIIPVEITVFDVSSYGASLHTYMHMHPSTCITFNMNTSISLVMSSIQITVLDVHPKLGYLVYTPIHMHPCIHHTHTSIQRPIHEVYSTKTADKPGYAIHGDYRFFFVCLSQSW